MREKRLAGFHWLADPLEIDGISTLYRFGGRDREFDRSQVINHRADVCRTLSVGQSMKGLLLGNDMAPIPDQFPIGTMFPATVVISDQFGGEYRAPVHLSVIRREKYCSSRRLEVQRRGGLFDRRDQHRAPLVGAHKETVG